MPQEKGNNNEQLRGTRGPLSRWQCRPDSQVVQDDRVTARGQRHRHPVNKDVALTWLETESRTLQHRESCLGDHHVTASLQRWLDRLRGCGWCVKSTSPGPSALSPQEEQPGPSRARHCRAQMGSGLGENKGERALGTKVTQCYGTLGDSTVGQEGGT